MMKSTSRASRRAASRGSLSVAEVALQRPCQAARSSGTRRAAAAPAPSERSPAGLDRRKLQGAGIGVSSPVISLNSVVLPSPLRPTIPTTSR